MSNKEYRLIGLTGPTGSGKSYVGRIFTQHGFAVVDADKIAHKALLDEECIAKLTEAFGDSILSFDREVNRKALAKCAFSSKENTEKLNSITHPVIIRLSLEKFSELYDMGFRNIIFDAPTLFEAGMDSLCEFVICVIAPSEIREARIKARDNLTDEQAKARISAQHKDEFYTKPSRYIIVNDNNTETLTKRTEEIIKEIL